MSARKHESATRLTGSRKAKQGAAVILEVFAGIRGAQEAGEALGVSPNRYYQLEARALQGLVAAMEPRPRGRTLTPEREREKLAAENTRLEKELLRYQALVRTAQRTIGLAKRGPSKAGSTRRRRPRTRAKTVLRTLRPKATAQSETETTSAPEA